MGFDETRLNCPLYFEKNEMSLYTLNNNHARQQPMTINRTIVCAAAKPVLLEKPILVDFLGAQWLIWWNVFLAGGVTVLCP